MPEAAPSDERGEEERARVGWRADGGISGREKDEKEERLKADGLGRASRQAEQRAERWTMNRSIDQYEKYKFTRPKVSASKSLLGDDRLRGQGA
jgi:hypothetical protein